MLTRKDYRAIAAIISVNSRTYREPTVSWNIVGALADYMVSDNPRFDRAKFIDACYRRSS